MNIYTYISPHDNPYDNLALEEALLNRSDTQCCIFYMYRNAHTVVIGKNQSAWRECRVERLREDGVTLARRITGGGAVYHDIENLNFSFIMPTPLYDVHKQLGVILQALHTLGIQGSFSGRNDLIAQGRKFSGNAFFNRKTTSLHHGTLLVGTRMEALVRYLQVPSEKIRTKGIQSVRERVINLKEIIPDLTVPMLADALLLAFQDAYGQAEALPEHLAAGEAVTALRDRNASWEWLYGASPKSDVTLETRFEWGGVTLEISLKQGVIERVEVFSDALDLAVIDALRLSLKGRRYDARDMADAVRPMPVDNGEARTQLTEWLSRVGN